MKIESWLTDPLPFNWAFLCFDCFKVPIRITPALMSRPLQLRLPLIRLPQSPNSNLFSTFPIRKLWPALDLVVNPNSDSKYSELPSSEHLRWRQTLHWNSIRRSFHSGVLIEVKSEVSVEGPSKVLVEALWNWLDRRSPALNRRLAYQGLIEGCPTLNRRLADQSLIERGLALNRRLLIRA